MARYKFFLLFFSILTFIIGAIWYALQTEIIIFSIPAFAEYAFQQTDKKTLLLFWRTEKEIIKESSECIWTKSASQNIKTVISSWLCSMQNEGLLDKRIKLETVALTPSCSEAFVSFSHTLFEAHMNSIKKWYVIESLFDTIRPLFKELKALRFLIHSQPLYDEHIDFSMSLPVTEFLLDYQTDIKNCLKNKQHYNIVIHPAGDKIKTGRVIVRDFERKLTRQVAEEIKGSLEKSGPFTVVITHDIGQQIQQEESASCANRLSADAYIHLNCFESKKILPEIICYFSLYNPATDFWHKKRDLLSFQPIDKAYLNNLNASLALCTTITENLKFLCEHRYIIHKPYGLPLTPLVGVQRTSCVIECGLQKPEQITEIAQVITQALRATALDE